MSVQLESRLSDNSSWGTLRQLPLVEGRAVRGAGFVGERWTTAGKRNLVLLYLCCFGSNWRLGRFASIPCCSRWCDQCLALAWGAHPAALPLPLPPWRPLLWSPRRPKCSRCGLRASHAGGRTLPGLRRRWRSGAPVQRVPASDSSCAGPAVGRRQRRSLPPLCQQLLTLTSQRRGPETTTVRLRGGAVPRSCLPVLLVQACSAAARVRQAHHACSLSTKKNRQS